MMTAMGDSSEGASKVLCMLFYALFAPGAGSCRVWLCQRVSVSVGSMRDHSFS